MENFWLNIDKPQGYSSAQVVAKVKKLLGAKKVGHGGTLDPLASGVLPVAVGKATKTSQYLMNEDKKYYLQINWGEFRDTDDAQGKIVKSSSARPKTNEIITILPQFIGKIMQTPPQFCALNVNGRRAYKMARQNQIVDLKPREVKIYNIKLIANDEQKAEFEIACGKGTYIRSFARELAEKLGVCGYVAVLRRLQVGSFSSKNIISLAKLKNMVNYCRRFDDFLLRLRDVLSFIPEIELDDLQTFKIKNGQKIICDNFSSGEVKLLKMINNNQLIGLGSFSKNILKAVNVF